MNTLKYILDKYNITIQHSGPIAIDYDREELARLFFELGYRKGAEIGVERGNYSEVLCAKNPDLRLFCIDPWAVYPGYEDIQDQHTMNVNLNLAKKRLAPYDCEIIRSTSKEAAKGFDPETLDFVYIDGNHTYDYALEDIRLWSGMVRNGGIVSGHDYVWRRHGVSTYDVRDALNQYFIDYGESILFLLNRQRSSTWFFVKGQHGHP